MALRKSTILEDQEKFLQEKVMKPYMLTPYILTIAEGEVTDIDIESFLEAGLRMVRFKVSHFAATDKTALLADLKKAISWCCDKHDKKLWPVAITVDLPNAFIMTGYLSDEKNANSVYLKKNSIVEVTCDLQYWNKCDAKRIFIDDAFTLPTIPLKAEISIHYGAIVMTCIEIVSTRAIKCRIDEPGELENAQFVHIRGVRHRRPPLSKLDRNLLQFAKDNELDAITINSVRNATTLTRARAFFSDCEVKPFIMCSICEQEGIDKFEEIVQEADGIILSREFLFRALTHPNRVNTIQLYVGAKCRELGKPFFVSGAVLESTLSYGTVTWREINDVTNAILQGAGFLLRNCTKPAHVVLAMELLNEISQNMENLAMRNHFISMCTKSLPPVNAAEATVFACAALAKQTGAEVVVVLTVTGWTAIKLAQILEQVAILTVSANPKIARQLQLYRSIIPIIYDEKGKREDWYVDMNRRVLFAEEYAVKNDMLRFNQNYIILRKGSPSSAFCDQISMWTVISEAGNSGVCVPDRNSSNSSSECE